MPSIQYMHFTTKQCSLHSFLLARCAYHERGCSSQSWLYGSVLQPFEPRAFELRRSCGYESERSKLLLRWSVVASDLLGALVKRRQGFALLLQTCSAHQFTWQEGDLRLWKSLLLTDYKDRLPVSGPTLCHRIGH